MVQLKLQALPAGTQIGVYEIKDVMCKDWSGILYRAWNEHLNAMVALKEYLPDGYTFKSKFSKNVSDYDYGLRKFLQLAELLSDIQQENVVSVHNVLQFNGTAYLAMDLVHGTPMAKIQNSPGSITDEEFEHILRSLLNALHAVHDKKIIHGDINPSNIIIKENGEPVLVNFASANIALSEKCKQIQKVSSSAITSAKSYRPDTISSPGSDLYALGATMFFYVTGKDPAPLSDRLEAIRNNHPDPCQIALEQQKTGISEPLLKTLLWMLTPIAEKRAQSAHEVLAKLDQDEDESDRQEKKVKNLVVENQLTTGLLKYGLAGFIIFSSVAIWYYMQHTEKPEDIVDYNRQNSLQIVAREVKSKENQLATEKQEKITQYLSAAKKNLDAFNLTTPLDNNAYDQYQSVLNIDKKNIQAKEGLQKIFNIYIQFVEDTIKEGKFKRAQIYIKRAEAIRPDALELRKLRKKLTETQAIAGK